MILPIVAYGDPVLRKTTEEIGKDYPGLDQLINDMFDTMYKASGVGLAAPQVGKAIRLFIVDGAGYAEDEPDLATFKKVFINPVIMEETGKEFAFNEGCLSIPTIREDIDRKPDIRIEYYDQDFKKHTEEYSGIAARIIQHEYDHIEGVLFVDKLGPLKKKMLKGRLDKISKGDVKVSYKMKFPHKK